MAGITYTDYPTIMNTDSLEWVALGYFTHISASVMQASLAGILLLSGLALLLGDAKRTFLTYLGATTGFIKHRRTIGSVQIFLSALLLLPLVAGISYLIAVVSSYCALSLYLVYQANLRTAANTQHQTGGWLRGLIIFAAFFTGSLSLFEEKDNLAFGIDVAFTAKKFRDREIAWQLEHDKLAPKVNQSAPNFTLKTAGDDATISLYDFLDKGKPLVLFFGANSCPVFSEGTVGINALFEKYKGRVNFLGVYVKEPHPSDEWWLTPSRLMTNLHAWEDSKAAVDIKQPVSQAEKNWAANRTFKTLLNQEINFLVDGIDNKVNNQWAGQPTRIYLLDPNGRIIYNPGTGPYAFNPGHLEPELEKYFQQQMALVQAE